MKQPWAWAIVHGGKDVENRVRNLAGDYRGPVAIHAGLTPDTSAQGLWPVGELIPAAAWQARGAIIGVVDLAGVHRTTDTPIPRCYETGVPNGIRDSCDSDRRLCSPWAESNGRMWHMELANPRPLAEPIPYCGALGLRTLPAEVVEQINRQLART
ncbi:hypothetical protein [Cryobacterium aureum]|uniref:hypothetical protein n=1 Tax=Cryobacterium aureum TaxID=995037 RepID=UPI00196B2E36|nr:hypothetical protein [Cryobacterium aureum]